MPAEWRLVRLRMPDGQRNDRFVEVTLLRPAAVVTAAGLHVGQTVPFEMAELGLRGRATVTAVEACPEIDEGIPGYSGDSILFLS